MELFERVKAILLNPKEEWEVIKAESAPHGKVFTGHLLILALIPAAVLFFHYWWEWHSNIQNLTDAATDSYRQDKLEDDIAVYKELHPLNAIFGIIKAATKFVTIVAGVYVSAAILNALSDNFGVQKDFNCAFALVAYSYTPLCVAGLFYIYPPIASIAPYIGLYGLYLLYIGVKPIINPPVEKATTCFITCIAVILATYFIIPKIVQPIEQDIEVKVRTKQAEERAKKKGLVFDSKKFQRELEKQMRNRD